MSTKQKPTPLTDALSFDNAGRIAVLKHARRMERDRAELLAALNDIADELRQSNGGKGPSGALTTHLLDIASAAIAKTKG